MLSPHTSANTSACPARSPLPAAARRASVPCAASTRTAWSTWRYPSSRGTVGTLHRDRGRGWKGRGVSFSRPHKERGREGRGVEEESTHHVAVVHHAPAVRQSLVVSARKRGVAHARRAEGVDGQQRPAARGAVRQLGGEERGQRSAQAVARDVQPPPRRPSRALRLRSSRAAAAAGGGGGGGAAADGVDERQQRPAYGVVGGAEARVHLLAACGGELKRHRGDGRSWLGRAYYIPE